MKNQITIRRLRSLFASFHENGAMVSLAGTWSRIPKNGLPSTDFLTRERIVKGKTVNEYLKTGSLADLFGALAWRIILACFPGQVRLINRLRVVNMFRGYLFSMYRKHGDTYTVKYLKACSLAISKSIGKEKLESLRVLEPDLALPRLTSSGLPKFIPSRDRRLIIGGSVPVIRFYMTLFSVYRVISIPGKLKLETIIQSPTVTLDSIKEVADQLINLINPSMFHVKSLYREGRLSWLETASPSHKVSWMGLFSDPKLLQSHKLDTVLISILKLLKKDNLVTLFECLLEMDLPHNHWLQRSKDVGKLSIKSEPAGKERVFAMVDSWTQVALKPIHDMLFGFLKSLPNDGTFDQHASEMRARSKAAIAGFSRGFDLTAATDRLPLLLQVDILNKLVPELGTLWSQLLVNRDYLLDITNYLKRDKFGNFPTSFLIKDVSYPIQVRPTDGGKDRYWISLRYATGQPMGALSSWAMLAITHHYLVQLAAMLAGLIGKGQWYENYELLGDDIIIFDDAVGSKYLDLMSKIGVPINTSKSVLANNPVTEFAKVTSYYGHNVSPISWKMFMSQNHLMGRANIAFSLLSRGVINSRINPWIENISKLSRTSQGNSTPTFIALLSMLASTGKIPMELVLKCLINGKVLAFSFYRSILLNADLTRIKQILPSLFAGKEIILIPNKRVEAIFGYEKPWFAITLWKPLAVFMHKVDPAKDALTLTRAIFGACLGHDEPGDKARIDFSTMGLEFDFGSIYENGYPTLHGEVPDVLQNDLVSLFSIFYASANEKLTGLSKNLMESPPQIDDDIPKLIDQTAEKDRYNEFMTIVERADHKVFVGGFSKTIVDSPLKSITFLRRMSVRPGFTKLQSFD